MSEEKAQYEQVFIAAIFSAAVGILCAVHVYGAAALAFCMYLGYINRKKL